MIRYLFRTIYNFMLDIPQFHMMYTASYVNGGSYIIGLLFGYLYHKYGKEKIFTSKVTKLNLT